MLFMSQIKAILYIFCFLGGLLGGNFGVFR